jgi:hypothetical protein
MPERSAAEAIYGHLPSSTQAPKQQAQPALGNAMWPSLSPQAKELDKARAKDRQRLLNELRELNSKLERKR